VLIGSHIPSADPLGTAAAEDADIVQIFLGDPQSWRKPAPREDAAALKAADLPI
jgi:deoxyribonuclease IV